MSPEDQKRLNTYIYDYLLKQSYGEAAKALKGETEIPTIAEQEARNRAENSEAAEGTLGTALDGKSKVQGKQSHTNGADRSSSASPKTDHRTLQSADVEINLEGGFLAEWWTMFWDMFAARQGRPSSNSAANFIAHNQVSPMEILWISSPELIEITAPQSRATGCFCDS